MELDIGDFMSNSYNWVPTQLYNDSLSCLTYNSNSLPEPTLPEAHVTNNLSSSNQTCPQIQALRDFMVYGNMANPSVASPHPSSTVSSRVTTPAASSLFYQLEGTATDSLLRTSGGIGCSSQSSKQPDMSLAYRALCSEIYATDRSPHRSQFQRENHILAERQRREEMNEKFSALRAMIPKATKVLLQEVTVSNPVLFRSSLDKDYHNGSNKWHDHLHIVYLFKQVMGNIDGKISVVSNMPSSIIWLPYQRNSYLLTDSLWSYFESTAITRTNGCKTGKAPQSLDKHQNEASCKYV